MGIFQIQGFCVAGWKVTIRCFIDKYNRNKNKTDIKLPIAPKQGNGQIRLIMYCIRLIDGKFVQNRCM